MKSGICGCHGSPVIWYHRWIEQGVPFYFEREGHFCRITDTMEIEGEWFIRSTFEWVSVGQFSKEWVDANGTK